MNTKAVVDCVFCHLMKKMVKEVTQKKREKVQNSKIVIPI